jgi:hypothetical protein
MNTLNELALECGTDKATTYPTGETACGFAPHYDWLFTPLRNSPIRLLEIGVAGGSSVRMWLRYFSQALIFGVDLADSGFQAERYTLTLGDQAEPEFWQQFIAKHGSKWDIIVDDGGHYNYQVITSFNCLWPHVAPGGFYAVENVPIAQNTAYATKGWPTQIEWIRSKIPFDGGDIELLLFFRELAIFKKKP